MHYLAIDVGSKYLGIAIGDIQNKIASPLTTIKFNQNNFSQAVSLLKNKINFYGYQIAKCIIGWPVNANGSLSKANVMVETFCNELKKQLNWDIVLYDERYTTKIAKELLSDMELKGSIRDKNVDRISACVILQSYFNDEQR